MSDFCILRVDYNVVPFLFVVCVVCFLDNILREYISGQLNHILVTEKKAFIV